MRWKKAEGDWTRFRELPGVVEVDLHWSDAEHVGQTQEFFSRVKYEVLVALKEAQQEGHRYVIFRHGAGFGYVGARTVVRGVMEKKEATPYIIRRDCIQHPEAFVAAVRPLADDEQG